MIIDKKGQPIKKLCVVCNQDFWTNAFNHVDVVCSRDCRLQHSRDLTKAKAVARHKTKDLSFDCRECGDFVDPEYGDKRRVYCSDSCNKKYWKRAGKNRLSTQGTTNP
jgi:hypothetical protein